MIWPDLEHLRDGAPQTYSGIIYLISKQCTTSRTVHDGNDEIQRVSRRGGVLLKRVSDSVRARASVLVTTGCGGWHSTVFAVYQRFFGSTTSVLWWRGASSCTAACCGRKARKQRTIFAVVLGREEKNATKHPSKILNLKRRYLRKVRIVALLQRLESQGLNFYP